MGKIIESLSIEQARKLILLSQKLPPVKQTGSAIKKTLSAIEHLGYIQIDTISVIQRAHHHTLWNRNPSYETSHIDELIKNKQIFEYWSHAAAYLPMQDYRYSLFRKEELKSGKQNHWYKRDEKLIESVLERITEEGPLMAKDFGNHGKKVGEWQAKPNKQTLEHLFMQGDLMVSHRNNFHKVYDLTERVLPKNIDTTLPTPREYARFLIIKYLQANGIGQVNEMTYLLKNIKPFLSTVLQEMLSNRELMKVSIEGGIYYMLPDSLDLLDKRLTRSRLKILSPFDNLLIQRKRVQTLFDFDYQIECYTPKEKRKYGYFSLPILWDGRLVARMDCKVERDKSILHINHLALESTLKKLDTFAFALVKELILFMKFNNCKYIELHRTTPTNVKTFLQNIITKKESQK